MEDTLILLYALKNICFSEHVEHSFSKNYQKFF